MYIMTSLGNNSEQEFMVLPVLANTTGFHQSELKVDTHTYYPLLFLKCCFQRVQTCGHELETSKQPFMSCCAFRNVKFF